MSLQSGNNHPGLVEPIVRSAVDVHPYVFQFHDHFPHFWAIRVWAIRATVTPHTASVGRLSPTCGYLTSVATTR